MTDREGERGEVGRQREESAGRRRRERRGRLKHKELVVGKTLQTFRQKTPNYMTLNMCERNCHLTTAI